jgi:hypothetical protein
MAAGERIRRAKADLEQAPVTLRGCDQRCACDQSRHPRRRDELAPAMQVAAKSKRGNGGCAFQMILMGAGMADYTGVWRGHAGGPAAPCPALGNEQTTIARAVTLNLFQY